MDETSIASCMKELGFQILDQDEKVFATQVANTWSVPLTEGILRLEEFAKKNANEDLYKEFLIRGLAKDKALIAVVPEVKLKALEKKLDSFSKTLFSVAKKLPSNETIHFKLEPTQVIQLPLDCGQRPVEVHVIPEARPAMEKEKKKNIFAAPGGSKKPTKVEEKKPEAKKSPPETKTRPDVTPKKEPTSPSPSKNASSLKKSPGKGKPVAKPQLGKGSIASFFGQKPVKSAIVSTSKETIEDMEVTVSRVEEKEEEKKEKPVKEEKKTPKLEKKSQEVAKKSSSEDSTRKRNLSSDRGSESDKKNKSTEEPSSKKAKKEVKTKKVEKRSRIMAICDSESSDEEQAKETRKESEDEEEPEKKPKAVEQKKSPDENRNPEKQKRRKATRKVTRSYQDEDGFIRTVRETEEYSCSDEEPVPTSEAKKDLKSTQSEAAAKPSVSSTLKPKVPTKQGSIMSFFGKK